MDRHGGESKLYMERALYRDFQLRTSTYSTGPVCVGLTTAQPTQRKPGSFAEERDIHLDRVACLDRADGRLS